MSLIKRLSAVLIALAMVMPASAQFAIGPRLGVNVNSLHFNESTFDDDNRAGFTAGVEIEFVVPVVNLGFDLSAMYVRRNSQFMQQLEESTSVQNLHSDYIEIPLNLKYKLGLPVIGKVFTPYIFTGPSFAFLTSKKAFQDFTKKKCDIAWNVGIGVQLISHLQIGASYGFGITKAVKCIKPSLEGVGIEGKNRYWTITAAWLF